MPKITINFSTINLGCTKNLVDLEYNLGEILKLDSKENEFNFFPNPEEREVEYVILNTCGFLSSSRDEAESTMKYYDDLGKKLIIIGCYVPVKNDNFVASLKNLASIVDYNNIKNTKEILLGGEKLEKLKIGLSKLKTKQIKKYLGKIGGDQIGNKAFIYGTESVRAFLHADKSYEYLKIAEGCNNKCSFCIIPNIRGKQRSRTIEDILQEVKIMINSGIKEIEIISQDTTRYGVDLYKAPQLLELLEQIDKIPGDFKYRLFYMYPDILSLKHLERLSKLKKMLPYFDFPFQHISQKVLKNMGRFYDDKHIFKLLDYIKNNFKNPFFHTNFIVGFPGEAEEDFQKLLDFAEKYEFDSVSVFGYHDEPLAESSKLENKIKTSTIENRLKKLKKVLNKIYNKKEKVRQGIKQIGFIEKIDEKNQTLKIRPEIKAPEIDELDEVNFKNLIGAKYINIGDKVKYMLK